MCLILISIALNCYQCSAVTKTELFLNSYVQAGQLLWVVTAMETVVQKKELPQYLKESTVQQDAMEERQSVTSKAKLCAQCPSTVAS